MDTRHPGGHNSFYRNKNGQILAEIRAFLPTPSENRFSGDLVLSRKTSVDHWRHNIRTTFEIIMIGREPRAKCQVPSVHRQYIVHCKLYCLHRSFIFSVHKTLNIANTSRTHSFFAQNFINDFIIDSKYLFHFLLWCHWSDFWDRCYLISFRSSNWISKTWKNDVIGCRYLGQYLTVLAPVKKNVSPVLSSTYTFPGKIDCTTPLSAHWPYTKLIF